MPDFTQQQLQAQALREQGLNPAQQASQDMGDIEFQSDIANRRGPMGYAMELDPAVANFVAFPGGPEQYTTNGAFNPHDEPVHSWIDPGNRATVKTTIQPGEIDAYGVQGANPKTWGHEYMHKEQRTSEGAQRESDAFTARNKREWDEVMKGYAGYRGGDWTQERADAHFRSKFKGKDRRFDRLDQHAQKEWDQGARGSTVDEQTLFSKAMDKVSNDPENMASRKRRRALDRYVKERVPQTYIGRELRGGRDD